jgi:hypothetical protein
MNDMKVGYEKTFTIRYNVHIFPYLYIANHVIAHDVKILQELQK